VKQPAEFASVGSDCVASYTGWSSEEKSSSLAPTPKPAPSEGINCSGPFDFASQRTSIPKIVVDWRLAPGAQAKQTNVMAVAHFLQELSEDPSAAMSSIQARREGKEKQQL